MTISLMLPGFVSGALQELLGYRMFFVVIMMSCVVTFLVTKFVHIDPEFGRKDDLEIEDE